MGNTYSNCPPPTDDEVEQILTCPISFDRMQDPVTLVQTGQTYDRKSLCEWLITDPTLCPASNRRFIDKLEYTDNLIARKLLVLYFGDGAYQRHGDSDFEQQYDKAYKKQQLKENDDASVQFRLGFRYEKGDGVPQDYKQARLCYERAANLGSTVAQYNLGVLYHHGRGIAQDYIKAQHYYKLAADQGRASAQYNLAYLYEAGHGVTNDYTKAQHYYNLAAEQGHKSAQNNLGILYEEGRGVTKDYVKAREYYVLAAGQGHAKAQNNLGLLYANGNIGTKDYAKARHYFELAADQGSASAQSNLAHLYEHGIGVAKDYTKARHYYNLAAEQGNAIAQRNLGYFYKNGRKYEGASEQGGVPAQNRLARLERKQKRGLVIRKWKIMLKH